MKFIFIHCLPRENWPSMKRRDAWVFPWVCASSKGKQTIQWFPISQNKTVSLMRRLKLVALCITENTHQLQMAYVVKSVDVCIKVALIDIFTLTMDQFTMCNVKRDYFHPYLQPSPPRFNPLVLQSTLCTQWHECVCVLACIVHIHSSYMCAWHECIQLMCVCSVHSFCSVCLNL